MGILLGVLLALQAQAMGAGAPVAGGEAGEHAVIVEHVQHGFAFESAGAVLSQRDWPEVTDPRKFVWETILKAGETSLYVHYWTTGDAGWWLEEVAAYLFEPENAVTADVTRNGYDVVTIDMPAGPQAPQMLDVLVLTPGGMFRITCPECAARQGKAALERVLDTLVALGGE